MKTEHKIAELFNPSSTEYLSELNKLLLFWTKTLMEQLCERFEDMSSWQIMGLVEADIIESADKIYAVEKKPGVVYDRKHDKQEIDDADSIFTCEYIWQQVGVDVDDYYGVVLLPIDGKLFLKIAYSC